MTKIKYKDLKNGDYFKICREKSNDIYIKKEYYFVNATNEKVAYHKLWGGTLVEKIEL